MEVSVLIFNKLDLQNNHDHDKCVIIHVLLESNVTFSYHIKTIKYTR